MDLVTLFILAVGLSMDAFAVSICKGLATQKYKFKTADSSSVRILLSAVAVLFGNDSII